MNLNQATYKKLTLISNSFGRNITIAVDFLFYVFDTFAIAEKTTMLKYCKLAKEEKEDVIKTSKEKEEHKSPLEIKIELNTLLEARISKLMRECQKLKTFSDAIEFLLFVLNNVQKEILEDLLIRYSLENQSYENTQPEPKSSIARQSEDLIDIDPLFPPSDLAIKTILPMVQEYGI